MQQLQRRLGTAQATFIGLGSMIGAGVFAAFAPAAASAGSWLLLGLAIAALVATCNALASAQLAARYPTSGGTYVYGREELGPWWGFFAGWSFVIGKTASCAAMALTFAVYVAPDGWERPVAAAAVVALAAVNLVGITRTAMLTRVIVVLVIAVLAVGVAASTSSRVPLEWSLPDGVYGVLQSAGLLFFAFAGYARIATLGEEVRDPQRSIPRAIITALAIAVAVYAVVGAGLLSALGAQGLAASSEPLADAVTAGGFAELGPVIAIGAALASLGALLALIAGIGRTTLAMARESDLPRWLAAVHPRFGVPHRAELLLAAVVVVLVLTIDLRGAIGFSSFGVLLYYFVANLAALRKGRPRALFVIGALGCVTLVATLPLSSIIGGLVVLAVGVLYRILRLHTLARTVNGERDSELPRNL